MPRSLDIQSYPHILDDVLFQLHEAGNYKTLAACRLTCSIVKDIVDSRLPEWISLSLGIKGTRSTRFWSLDTSGWSISPVDRVFDVHTGKTKDLILDRQSHSGHRRDVVRIFGTNAFNGNTLASPIDTLIFFPDSPQREGATYLLPLRTRRIVIHRLYTAQTTPFNLLFCNPRASELADKPIQQEEVASQEVVLMMSPSHVFNRVRSNIPGALMKYLLPNCFRNLRRNPHLKITLVGSEEWSYHWFEMSSQARAHSRAFDRPDDIITARQYLLQDSLTRWAYLKAVTTYSERIKFVTDAEYKERVGPALFRLMKAP